MIKKVVLSFPVDATDRSLTYDLVKLYDIKINILKAEIQAGKSGNLLVELEAGEDMLNQGIAYLKEKWRIRQSGVQQSFFRRISVY